jgi:alkylation response protein AidB-like acyl-CoA dehydrogenase
MPLPQYRSALELERHLGSPLDATRPFCFQRALELDEAEEFPEECCAHLSRWGFYDYLVPQRFGGKLRSFEESLALVRALARRDLTVAIGAGVAFLGSLPVWLAGSEAQRQTLTARVRAGQALALALSERGHGSDLAATEVEAVRQGGGFELSGEKWLINGATRASTVTVLARTDPAGGPRALSFLLLDKQKLEPGSYTLLPKVKTLGVRGADISGIRFERTPLASDAVVGKLGEGLELGIKVLQVSRTMCAALSLGAGDTALRATVAFARERQLYGTRVVAMGPARRALADAWADTLLCDALSLSAARSIHVVPEQMSAVSAVVKYLVPTTLEQMTQSLAVVLGARYYLREGHQCGIFQKSLRDGAVVSLFDGNTAVNLQGIALQLKLLLNARRDRHPEEPELAWRLAETYALDRPLGEFDPARLTLASPGRNDALQGLEVALAALREGPSGADPSVVQAIAERTLRVQARVERLRTGIARLHSILGIGLSRSAEGFAAAREYALLHAVAACVHLWLHSRTLLDESFARGEWLVLTLSRALERLREPLPDPVGYEERALQELLGRCDRQQQFGAVAMPLGKESHAA